MGIQYTVWQLSLILYCLFGSFKRVDLRSSHHRGKKKIFQLCMVTDVSYLLWWSFPKIYKYSYFVHLKIIVLHVRPQYKEIFFFSAYLAHRWAHKELWNPAGWPLASSAWGAGSTAVDLRPQASLPSYTNLGTWPQPILLSDQGECLNESTRQ